MKVRIDALGKSKAEVEEALYKALRAKRKPKHSHPFPDPLVERTARDVKKAHARMLRELMVEIDAVLRKP